MVAVHSTSLHTSWPVGVPSAAVSGPSAERVDDAASLLRAQVEALSAGLPDALLATSPSEIRALAARANAAADRAARRRARVGDRPDVDEDAVAAALAASRAAADARSSHGDEAGIRHRRLAVANGLAIAALGGAFALMTLGMAPFSLPVAAAVAGAGSAPLAVGALSVATAVSARKRVTSSRATFAVALEASGFETLGQLSAAHLAVEAWRRRAVEAEHAERAARLADDEWRCVAGPGVGPGDIERVLARLRLLRAVQLRLLETLLERHASRVVGEPSASCDTTPTDAAAAAPCLAADPAGDGWLGGALDRIRGRRLHLFG